MGLMGGQEVMNLSFDREAVVIEDRWSVGNTVWLKVNNSLHCSQIGRRKGAMHNRTDRL